VLPITKLLVGCVPVVPVPPFLSPIQTDKYPAWEVIYAELTSAGVQTVSAEDAFDMSELGKAVVVDVRPTQDHQQVGGGPPACCRGAL
jgi:hypothetical protein